MVEINEPRRTFWRGLAALALGSVLAACHSSNKPPSVFDGEANYQEFQELKANIQGQDERVQAMKLAGTTREGSMGFLVKGTDAILPIDQRQVVQQQNVWRESMFALIGQRCKVSKEDVEKAFVEMAERNEDSAGTKK